MWRSVWLGRRRLIFLVSSWRWICLMWRQPRLRSMRSLPGGRVDAVVNNFGYSDAFDVIIAFDAVHDQVQPARVLAMSRCAKAPDEFGSLLLQLHAIRG
jgi:hypothetical protein